MTPSRPQSVPRSSPLPQPPALELLKPKSIPASTTALRLAFWSAGVLLATVQAWVFRYEVSADSISYLDMSDGVLRGGDGHLLINGTYSALYPFFLGVFRRIFHISPANEIPAAHLLGVMIFIFAFACFEFVLVGAMRMLEAPEGISGERRAIPLPKWAFLSVAYSMFLWAAIVHIQLVVPRADMLMSGFLCLAVGVLLRMHGHPARWASFLALGAVLGMAILAKEAMLVMGALILSTTPFVVDPWRPALKMASGALAVMLLIGSVYFVPLSLRVGHFTLGEAGSFVYIVNVDEASPHWYLQSPGSAKGSFVHPPEKIFSDPPAYAFGIPAAVTHPLRFDPSYWTMGPRPRLVWQREITAVKMNLRTIAKLFGELRVVVGTLFVLAYLCSGKKQVLAALTRAWPVWLIGLAGCLLYLAIYVEPRYVAAFLTLLCLGILIGFPVPAESGRRIAQLIVIATFVMLLYPVPKRAYGGYAPNSNVSFIAAQALENLGIKAGDRVARISPGVADFAVERTLRVQIVAEVDHDHAAEFWSSSLATQQALLSDFVSRGARAVIATAPTLSAANQMEWTRLGSTGYWVWRPASK